MISTGSSTKLSLLSSRSSFIGMTRDSSDRHFFRLETWKVLWTLLSSSGSSSVYATGPTLSRILNGLMYQGLSFPHFPNQMTPFQGILPTSPYHVMLSHCSFIDSVPLIVLADVHVSRFCFFRGSIKGVVVLGSSRFSMEALPSVDIEASDSLGKRSRPEKGIFCACRTGSVGPPWVSVPTSLASAPGISSSIGLDDMERVVKRVGPGVKSVELLKVEKDVEALEDGNGHHQNRSKRVEHLEKAFMTAIKSRRRKKSLVIP
ncbi:hypothetical protein Tco_0633042 [Tanacetum coccineum]